MLFATEKLTQQIRFRSTDSFFTKLVLLVKRSGWDSSDILRTGLDLCWSDIEAHIISQTAGKAGVTPAERRALADFRRLTGKDPVAVLTEAARLHLAAAATASATPGRRRK